MTGRIMFSRCLSISAFSFRLVYMIFHKLVGGNLPAPYVTHFMPSHLDTTDLPENQGAWCICRRRPNSPSLLFRCTRLMALCNTVFRLLVGRAYWRSEL